ncbi:MAG: M48 family metallopeptidase [Thiolinea sp.]
MNNARKPPYIEGYWYPPNSSTRHPARLKLDGQRYTISPTDQHTLQGNFQQLDISDRVGNIPRKLVLADHSLFETSDNDGIDQLLEQSGHEAHSSGILHQLETRWRWILTALLVTALLSLVTVRWGMPWASKQIAYSLPVSVHELISAETMQVLDESLMKPSKLPKARQREIQQHFESALLPLQNSDFRYQLHFRSMPMTPNAFALPSGDIIITDELVELAENQQEIDSILLHEIGHVAHRHGMRQVIQSSFITLALIMITGEVSAVGEWAVAFPVFLMQSHYSREHESDADEFAFERMMKAGIDPIHFANIMQRLGKSSFNMFDEDDSSAKDESDNNDQQAEKDQTNAQEGITSPGNSEELQPDGKVLTDRVEKTLEYLMSHPATADRVAKARAYSKQFHEQAEQEE